MIKAHSYIYTVFGIKASPYKLTQAHPSGPGSGLANEDHCFQAECDLLRSPPSVHGGVKI